MNYNKVYPHNYEGDFRVVVSNMESGDALGFEGSKALSLNYMKSFHLSADKPIAFDNGALYVLFKDVLNEFDRLEKENSKLKDKLRKIKDLCP